ncbi:hypothetical protein [Actinoplanes utahensis]|uniref:hypothetical protein n=1 Tax=Actinoplanes utahensis TaxID=1869 RepID=UPI00068EC8F7|nr:hypothetical protein [Actinoplanes utahensis]
MPRLPHDRTWLLGAFGITTAFSLLLGLALLPQGPGAAAFMLIPVTLTAVPLIVRRRHRRRAALVSTATLALTAVLSLPSVGAFLLPGVILLAIGSFKP